MFGLSGLLAAVIERQRTGIGRHLDVSMFDGTFALNVFAYAHMQGHMKRINANGNFLSGNQPFYNLYETKDGKYMSLGAVEPKFWHNFCVVVGRKNLASQQFGGARVLEEVSGLFKQRTQAEWVEHLKDADACCEPVLSLEQAMNSPLGKSRGVTIQNIEGKNVFTLSIKTVGEKPTKPKPSPKLGGNNSITHGSSQYFPGQ